jgi:23S rRNA pseudouridine1911/1915/1917 synthase
MAGARAARVPAPRTPAAVPPAPRARRILEPEQSGLRADLALAARAGIPRAQARRWIDDGRVWLNTRPCRASERVRAGDVLEAAPPPLEPSGALPEEIPLALLYEDADLLVIDKPAGLVVHPAPGHARGTLVNALLHHCQDLAGVGGVERPGIVHRLDRGTSGVLVVAKNDAAHAGLAAQFADHSIERVYLAFVRGVPQAETGVVDRPIGRHPTDRKRMSVRTARGRAARTRWRVAERFPASNAALLEVRPETGRTHQIRVHLAASGLPILGDPSYGRARAAARGPERALERPALHAALLGITHPRTGLRLRFEAPLPPDLQALRQALRRAEQA